MLEFLSSLSLTEWVLAYLLVNAWMVLFMACHTKLERLPYGSAATGALISVPLFTFLVILVVVKATFIGIFETIRYAWSRA